MTILEPDFMKGKWWDEINFKPKSNAPQEIKEEYKEWMKNLDTIEEE